MSESRESTARNLGELMREATPEASRQHHLEGRARLIASVERMREPSRAKPVLVAFAFAAALAAVVLVVMLRQPQRAIAWHVEGADVGAQGYVSITPAGPPAHLVFDDGSDVALVPGSRGRVAATTATGAEVVLEQGRARVRVKHREKTSWTIDAGPYAVRVTGTELLVAWAAGAETLDVWMQSGTASVAGPVVGEGLALAAGQHVTARVRESSVQIDAAAAPADSAPAPSTTASAADVEPTPSGALVEPPAAPSAAVAAPSWPKLVAVGDYARVLHDADAEGIAHATGARPLPDLRALGDAARYAGRPDVSKRAYAAIRARFPASGEARTAAFLIGRIEEEQDHATAGALRWYDTYLAEAPAGPFAGDALGRKMVIVSRTQGRDAARPLADRYLQRFPAGSYAAAARDLEQ
ncbi:MAG TPA: FecR domain-containing protein [Polyangiaceae bacterium]|nr:FecR domain-containing protein [Polyangiaceae bacterium]